jgi:hypothetical protein
MIGGTMGDKQDTYTMADAGLITKCYWLEGTEYLVQNETEAQIARKLAKIIKHTPDIVSVKIDVRWGIHVEQAERHPRTDRAIKSSEHNREG